MAYTQPYQNPLTKQMQSMRPAQVQIPQQQPSLGQSILNAALENALKQRYADAELQQNLAKQIELYKAQNAIQNQYKEDERSKQRDAFNSFSSGIEQFKQQTGKNPTSLDLYRIASNSGMDSKTAADLTKQYLAGRGNSDYKTRERWDPSTGMTYQEEMYIDENGNRGWRPYGAKLTKEQKQYDPAEAQRKKEAWYEVGMKAAKSFGWTPTVKVLDQETGEYLEQPNPVSADSLLRNIISDPTRSDADRLKASQGLNGLNTYFGVSGKASNDAISRDQAKMQMEQALGRPVTNEEFLRAQNMFQNSRQQVGAVPDTAGLVATQYQADQAQPMSTKERLLQMAGKKNANQNPSQPMTIEDAAAQLNIGGVPPIGHETLRAKIPGAGPKDITKYNTKDVQSALAGPAGSVEPGATAPIVWPVGKIASEMASSIKDVTGRKIGDKKIEKWLDAMVNDSSISTENPEDIQKVIWSYVNVLPYKNDQKQDIYNSVIDSLNMYTDN